MSKKPGRPEIPPEEVVRLQELYLSLLRLGKTEIEINAVEGMVSWDTRWRWLDDEDFSARRLESQRQGVELKLVDYENRAAQVYEKAWDDAASPALVATLKELGHHARWKAAKLAPGVYGDKVDVTSKGEALKSTIVVATSADKELLDKL